MPQEKQIEDMKLEKIKLEKPVEKVEEKIVETQKEENKEVVTNNKQDKEVKQSSETTLKSSDVTDKVGTTSKDVVIHKKTEAVVNGNDLRISTKHAVAICNYIKNKNIDVAIHSLYEVGNMKKPIPMKGEIPHRKGIMSGRYPLKAVAEFIKLLKSLKANAITNELELEKFKLFCMANVASRPHKRFGRARFKRTHVQLKLIPIAKKKNKEDKK